MLLRRVKNLGDVGAVKAVKRGFANFLLREKFVLRATKDNLAYFESQKATLLKQDQDLLEKAKGVQAKLSQKTLTLVCSAGDSGQLYGSVSAKELAALLLGEGLDSVKPSIILLQKPIKTTGAHSFVLQLHPEIDMTLELIVGRTQEDIIQIQKKIKEEAEAAAAKKLKESMVKKEPKADTTADKHLDAGESQTQSPSDPAAHVSGSETEDNSNNT